MRLQLVVVDIFLLMKWKIFMWLRDVLALINPLDFSADWCASLRRFHQQGCKTAHSTQVSKLFDMKCLSFHSCSSSVLE